MKIQLAVTLLILTQSCAIFNRNPGELTLVDPDHEEGFNYPYFLFIPDQMNSRKEIYMIMEPNNSGFTNDTLEKHIEKARRTAMKDFYIGNYLSVKLGYPLLVPVFPRPDSCWKIYTHALDRDVIMQKGNPMERLDLQLLAMVENARSMLEVKGYRINPKVLMTGFSASGTFVNRFSLIHPGKVMAYAAGGLNGLLMLPLGELEGEELNYPVGINDFEQIFGKKFEYELFREIPQFLFMGENDKNDAIPYEDGYDLAERELIYRVLGKEMQPVRWQACQDLYRKYGVNAAFNTYKGLGHEHPIKIKKDILKFFKSTLEP